MSLMLKSQRRSDVLFTFELLSELFSGRFNLSGSDSALGESALYDEPGGAFT